MSVGLSLQIKGHGQGVANAASNLPHRFIDRIDATCMGLVAGIAVIVVGIIHQGDSVLAWPQSVMPMRDAMDGYAPLPKIRSSISAAGFPRQPLAMTPDRSTGSNRIGDEC